MTEDDEYYVNNALRCLYQTSNALREMATKSKKAERKKFLLMADKCYKAATLLEDII